MRIPSVLRVAGITGLGGAAALALSAASARAGGSDDASVVDTKTTVTIWRAPSPNATYQYGQYGGYGYGTAPSAPGDAAFVTHRRSVDVKADGELRFPGVSTRIDPSTVQFRSITDPKGTSVVEQKFAYDLGSPEHLMHRYVGKQVTITTARGEVTGTLRGIDSDALMIETGSGKDRAVEIVKRGENLLDVKLAAADDTLATVPTLVWKIQTKKAGKQDVEVSYRTEGLHWDADYTAILDEDKSSVDLSAWATVSNDTGIELKDAQLDLVTGILDNAAPASGYPGAYVARANGAEPDSFTVPRAVTIAAGGTVQVELIPARSNVASRRVVVYETTPDMSASYQSYMYTDCYSYSQSPQTGAHGEIDLEVDAPAKNMVLPEGGVRIFKRKGDGLELLGEDTLHVNGETGHARLRLGNDDSVTGTRRQLECKFDDHARTLREKFEIEVENKNKEPVEVVLKEYMYRWVNWKMDGEDIAGSKAAPQTQEYRVKLGANSKKTFSYAVLYFVVTGAVKRGLAIIVLAGCGGHAATVHAPGAPSGGSRDLVLYRDGAMIRDRTEVDAKVGHSIVTMQVPTDVGAGDLVARVLSPASGVDVGAVQVIEPHLEIGDHVTAIDGKRTISGVLRMMGEGSWAIETGEGIRLVLDARHIVRDSGGERHVDVELDATTAAHATIELVYVTRKLSWSAEYTLVMDEAARRGELHGALGIDNGTGVGYGGATLTLVDTARPTKLTAFDQTIDEDGGAKPGQPVPVVDPTKPRAEQPVKLIKPAETPRTVLPFLVDVAPGSQSVSLLGRIVALPATQTLVYDPIGEDKNQPGREPYTERDYGLDKQTDEVSQSIDIDLAGASDLTGLPAGRVRLLERTETGALSPLGEARIFERAGTDTQAISPTTSVAVGRAGELLGSRKRREFTLDTESRRLIEEFEIDLTSTADHPVDVIVREHMYRGLNWTLAYENAGTKVIKEGPQKVAMSTTVPKQGTARVIYRVVYHW